MDKILTLNAAGEISEYAGIQISAGVADAGKYIATTSAGTLDPTILPSGIGADTKTAIASEALSAGDLVNLYNNAGVLNARKADASGGVAKQADGFVIASVASAGTATVYLDGTISGLSSLTIGSKYFLSGSTAGAITATRPTTSAYIVQPVGKAVSATELAFEADSPIILL